MKSKNDDITEVFIQISIIRLIISRKLFSIARRILNSEKFNKQKKGLSYRCHNSFDRLQCNPGVPNLTFTVCPRITASYLFRKLRGRNGRIEV